MNDISQFPADVAARVRSRMAQESDSAPDWLKQQRALKDLGISLVIGELEDGRTIRSWSGGGFFVRAAYSHRRHSFGMEGVLGARARRTWWAGESRARQTRMARPARSPLPMPGAWIGCPKPGTRKWKWCPSPKSC